MFLFLFFLLRDSLLIYLQHFYWLPNFTCKLFTFVERLFLIFIASCSCFVAVIASFIFFENVHHSFCFSIVFSSDPTGCLFLLRFFPDFFFSLFLFIAALLQCLLNLEHTFMCRSDALSCQLEGLGGGGSTCWLVNFIIGWTVMQWTAFSFLHMSLWRHLSSRATHLP